MSVLMVSLLIFLLFNALFLLICFAIATFLPASFLGGQAKAVLTWLPPFMRGESLRNWAATTAEQLTAKRLAGQPSGETAARLAKEVEEGAMRAMLPTAGPAELVRIVACPEAGQERIGVTAPEALAIAAYVRKKLPRIEQEVIYEMAVANARKLASEPRPEADAPPLPCPLKGDDHVCCVYAARPLRCRPLHAIAVAQEMRSHAEPAAGGPAEAPEVTRHEQTVAEGIELGLTRGLKSAGLDADVYELNSALATALGTPDAAERWAKGEHVFHSPLA